MPDRLKYLFITLWIFIFLTSCNQQKTEDQNLAEQQTSEFMDEPGEIKLITVDPGHFHASLVQKSMYPQVDPLVHVYAPEGPELEDHLNRINQFNNRQSAPTQWREMIYKGSDYLEKMLSEKPGNVMVVAGNNAKKTDYIHAAVLNGIHVLADKPMVIDPEKYSLLQEAFRIAKQKGLLIYDMMTERFEVTTILQKEFSGFPQIFGEMEKGSVDNPAISKESVHHFYKYVAGRPLQRPPWFFDIKQEGAGIVDVSTHLVDLILWECFPEQPVLNNEVGVVRARQWATEIGTNEFKRVTGLSAYPDYLEKYLTEDSVLNVLSNGEFVFTVRNIFSKVSVIWNFEAPEGSGDTHFSIMRGNRANLVIRQDAAQKYVPTLYVEPVDNINSEEYEAQLESVIQMLNTKYPGLAKKSVPGGWEIIVPNELRVGHEAHFGQVMEKFLQYMEEGQIPEWEKANMLTKYFITMEAYKVSRYTYSE
jgi:predicted dehydrogenase